MWKCHKCGKPVYFAERKQSLGYDWHPECLRCEECGKRLNPGQHAEHKGVPYCHVPCYGALFGPQLFGHGTRVESHKSFGQHRESPKLGNGPSFPRSHLESKLKLYNQFYDGKSGEIRSREVNGRLILEGSLRIHWGIHGLIHLKENDDQRTVVTVRKRNSYRLSSDYDSDEDLQDVTTESSCNDTTCSSDIMMSSTDTLSPDRVFPEEVIDKVNDTADSGIAPSTEISFTQSLDSDPISPSHKSLTLPTKLNMKSMEWDELDELLQVERRVDETEKLYQTMPVPLPSQTSIDSSSSTYSTDTSSTEKADKTETSEFSLTKTVTKTITKPVISQDDSWIDTSNHLNRSMSGPDCLERIRDHLDSPEFDRSTNTTSCDLSSSVDDTNSNPYTTSTQNTNTTQEDSSEYASDEVVLRKASKTGSTAIKRRTGKRLSRSKIKRRCSINGHFYDRETSFFTPPHGSQMSVWVSSLVSTQEVINLMLEKYKVDSQSNNFALFLIRDNGEQKRLKDDEYPLISRVMLGPHEDVVRLFLMDSHNTRDVSNEVAQFLNLSLAECRAILNQYCTQEDREIAKVRARFLEMKRRIKTRMEDLKVRL